LWEGKGKANHTRGLIQGKEGKTRRSKVIIKVSSLKINSKYLYSQYEMKHEDETHYINCQTQSTDLLYLDILNGKQTGKQVQKFYLVFQEDK